MTRFVLDHDVDAGVGRMLRQLGHEAWTASQAAMARAADEDIAIYADDKRAILITHDNEFATSSLRRRYGRLVWLKCEEPDAVDVLAKFLDDVLALMDRPGRDTLWLKITPSKIEVHFTTAWP